MNKKTKSQVNTVSKSSGKKKKNSPPDGLPVYRLITGVDDKEFCERVSEMIKKGYKLHGSPSITFNGKSVIAAQAIIWSSVQN